MTNNTGSSESGATEIRNVPILRTAGLLAEYTTGQAPWGEWFALGSVRSEQTLSSQPAWILVGAGSSADAAVGSLLHELGTEARRIASR